MTINELPTVEARWKGRTYSVSLIRWPSDGDDGAVFLDAAEPKGPYPVLQISDDGREKVIGFQVPLETGRAVGLREIESLVFFPCPE